MSQAALAERSAKVRSSLEAITFEDGIGADIVGFDFDNIDEAQVAQLRSIWLQHGVVRFRGYQISDEQHMLLTSMLGEFVKHPRQLKGRRVHTLAMKKSSSSAMRRSMEK